MIPTEEAAQAAADWLIRLRAAPDDDGQALRFETWLAAHPAHQAAFDQVCLAWNLLEEQPAGHIPAPLTARPAAPRRRAPQHGTRRPAPAQPAPPRRLRPWRVAALAAVAAGVLALALPGILLRMEADYITGTGETRVVQLADGSTVTLGAGSALAAHFSAGQRDVTLIAGEAFFDVAHDAARPFTVAGEDMRVRVLGTAFDMRIGSATADVALARGAVEASFGTGAAIQSRRMTPGDLLHYDTAQGTLTQERVAPDEIGAWREGRLVVVDATIGDVVERIRRYHPAWIALPDATLAAERVTGAYDLRHPDAALTALVEPFGGQVHTLSPYLRVIARL
ncbi:iron dicitrate transporter FecR [Azorhizobium oxalatiphilum]|uniref:Iron dicitrate transporter FecR n=1 Tax=Azorhizobium oxalatiphilum TaxID=980631 RepID=A0A917C4W3_9HYPH|nr:FecR family protein [Azorhizobium oxalatiphilum]GGF69124.1 iron dicitrate transporter FecR [Azorhizobium oxalatiphilum]